jgi:hypothetical protein
MHEISDSLETFPYLISPIIVSRRAGATSSAGLPITSKEKLKMKIVERFETELLSKDWIEW